MRDGPYGPSRRGWGGGRDTDDAGGRWKSLLPLFKVGGVTGHGAAELRSHREMKEGDKMICVWEATGLPENHDKIMEKLFTDPEVKELKF